MCTVRSRLETFVRKMSLRSVIQRIQGARAETTHGSIGMSLLFRRSFLFHHSSTGSRFSILYTAFTASRLHYRVLAFSPLPPLLSFDPSDDERCPTVTAGGRWRQRRRGRVDLNAALVDACERLFDLCVLLVVLHGATTTAAQCDHGGDEGEDDSSAATDRA